MLEAFFQIKRREDAKSISHQFLVALQSHFVAGKLESERQIFWQMKCGRIEMGSTFNFWCDEIGFELFHFFFACMYKYSFPVTDVLVDCGAACIHVRPKSVCDSSAFVPATCTLLYKCQCHVALQCCALSRQRPSDIGLLV